MNENELYVVKECKFDNPLITKIDLILYSWYRDYHKKYFDTFKHECFYDIKLTNITNIEIINLTISGKSMILYELIEKLPVARQNGFIINQINKLTIKIHSHSRYINISFYLTSPIPMCHTQLFRVISKNRDFVDNFCNDRNNPFHFACQKWIKICM